MHSNHHYLVNILTAPIYDLVKTTPLTYAQKISQTHHNSIFLKREDLQQTHSFKVRGAYHKLLKLEQEGKLGSGVVTVSTGNHAQGVALATQKLGEKAFIVMPKNTPTIKTQAVHWLNAEIVFYGETFAEAFSYSQLLAQKRNVPFVHPFDDPDIIAGQGTIGLEIAQQHPQPLSTVYVPVGGGGLIAGIALYIKTVRPEIQIVAVESEHSCCLRKALEKDQPVTLTHVDTFADGVAVKSVGQETFRLAKKYVDRTVTVTNDEICFAIKDIFEELRTLVEPAGALALAGLKKDVYENALSHRHLVAIVSGANTDFDRLSFISQRCLQPKTKSSKIGAPSA